MLQKTFVQITTLVLLTAGQVSAQVDTGRIVGTIQDSSGAVVAGATVHLMNQETGIAQTSTSGQSGSYVFPALKAGTYTIEVAVSGFQTLTRRQIPVHVQQDVTLDLVLTPGQVTERVEVTGAAPLLQAENASVGQTVEGGLVNDLPLNGRNWAQLAQLVAGATVVQSGYSAPGTFAVNGTSYLQNDYRLNGINNNNEEYAFMQVYSVLPPPDAIEEFRVQTSNYSAEFGRAGGGIVNATIKAGANRLHGDVWEYLRNSSLDATQFFENATNTPKGAYRQNQFGGTIGGPVVIPKIYNGRDRTFFFFDYQGTRIRQATPSLSNVPTDAMRSSGFTNLQDLITFQSGTRTDALGRVFPLGTVFDPATTRPVTAGAVDPVTGVKSPVTGAVRDPFFQGSLTGRMDFTSPGAKSLLNILPASRLDPNAIKLLGLFPAPNQAGLVNNFSYDPSTADDTNQYDIRIDQYFGTHDQLFGVINRQHQKVLQPGLLPGIADGAAFNQGPLDLPHRAFTLSESHTFSPTVQNELRLGYNRNIGNAINFESNTLGIPEQYGIQGIPQVPGNGGLPEINLAGLTSLGTSGWIPTLTLTQVFELTENLSKVYSSHTFKGGLQFDRIRGAITQPPFSHGIFNFGGSFTEVPNQGGGGTGLAQLLLTPIRSTVPNGFDYVGGADSVNASNFASTDDTRWYLGLYAQDDWKVTPRVTLNLGLRWDHFTPYREIYGAQANFIPGPPGNGAKFLIPNRRCKDPVSPSFTELMQRDGISVECSSNAALGEAQKLNFAPRFGFAWRLTPKFVMRGGYAISYGALSNIGYGPKLGGNYPFLFNFGYNAPDAAHPIVYPNGSLGTLETGFTGIPLNPTGVEAQFLSLNGRQYNFQTPYIQAFNFTLQYQLGANQTITAGYVGTLGRHLDSFPGANEASVILPPGLNPQNYVPFPDFARNSPYEATNSTSNYNSLQTTFERRLSEGLNFLSNYTYSRCRTDFLGGTGNVSGGYRAPYLSGFGIKGDYRLCDADVTHVFHFSGSYALPFGKGRRFLSGASGPVNQILGGWHMNGILTLQGGQPFTVGCPIGTTSNFGCNAFLVPGQDPYAGPHDVNQWLNPEAFAQPPVATAIGQTDYAPLGGAPTQVRGPGIRRMDFSLFKQFPIRESARLEFRAEVFNLTNTPMFNLPGNLDFTNTQSFSVISSVRDGGQDPRQIQFALKLYW